MMVRVVKQPQEPKPSPTLAQTIVKNFICCLIVMLRDRFVCLSIAPLLLLLGVEPPIPNSDAQCQQRSEPLHIIMSSNVIC